MKFEIERRKPGGFLDYVSLALTTFGVGYLPLAPGTWGSMVGVVIYLVIGRVELGLATPGLGGEQRAAFFVAVNSISLALFCLIGIWASNRAINLLGNEDPSEAVVDEIMGQLVTFLFIPFAYLFLPFGPGWPFVLAGFLLFRLFDIWKPFPVRTLEVLPGGLGVCADDLAAGVYAGICLSIIYAISIFI